MQPVYARRQLLDLIVLKKQDVQARQVPDLFTQLGQLIIIEDQYPQIPPQLHQTLRQCLQIILRCREMAQIRELVEAGGQREQEVVIELEFFEGGLIANLLWQGRQPIVSEVNLDEIGMFLQHTGRYRLNIVHPHIQPVRLIECR